jgi:hypothetical protein
MSIEESLTEGASWIVAGGVSLLGISALGLIRKENKRRRSMRDDLVLASTQNLKKIADELFLVGKYDPELGDKLGSYLEESKKYIASLQKKDLSRCSSRVRKNYLGALESIWREANRLSPEISDEYFVSLIGP